MIFLLVFFYVIFASYLSQPLTANFLQNQRGLDLATIGRLGSFASLGIVLLALSLGHIHPRWGFVLSQVASMLFSLLIWRGSGLAWYSAGYFFYGGMRVTKNLGVALVKPLVHPAQLGTAFGWMETACSAALIAAPVVAGLIYQAHPASIFPVSILLTGLAILLSLAHFSTNQRVSSPQKPEDPLI